MAGRCFGIFIGIDSVHLPEVRQLTEAARDAKQMYDVFRSSFDLDHTRSVLLDDANGRQAPCCAVVYDALESIRDSDAQPDDTVIFWFSGHGFEADGRTYLAVGDTDGSNRVHQQHTSVSLDSVRAYFDQIRVRTQLIVLDACRTGIAAARIDSKTRRQAPACP